MLLWLNPALGILAIAELEVAIAEVSLLCAAWRLETASEGVAAFSAFCRSVFAPLASERIWEV